MSAEESFMTDKPRPAVAKCVPEAQDVPGWDYRRRCAFWRSVIETVGSLTQEEGKREVHLVGYKDFLEVFADFVKRACKESQCRPLEHYRPPVEPPTRDSLVRAARFRGRLLADVPEDEMVRERLQVSADENAWHEVVVRGDFAAAVLGELYPEGDN